MLYSRNRVSSASKNDARKKFCTLLPDYPGALDKQTTPYQLTPQVKMEDARTSLKTSQVRTRGHVDTSSTSQMARDVAQYRRTCGASLKDCVRTLPYWIAMGETVRKGSTLKLMAEKHLPGNACSLHRQQGAFLSGYVDHITMSVQGSPSGTVIAWSCVVLRHDAASACTQVKDGGRSNPAETSGVGMPS